VALAGADGVLTVLNLPRVGWLTLEPIEDTPQAPAPLALRPSQ
jgi:hypothetical protein